jgi:hypothetical protein
MIQALAGVAGKLGASAATKASASQFGKMAAGEIGSAAGSKLASGLAKMDPIGTAIKGMGESFDALHGPVMNAAFEAVASPGVQVAQASHLQHAWGGREVGNISPLFEKADGGAERGPVMKQPAQPDPNVIEAKPQQITNLPPRPGVAGQTISAPPRPPGNSPLYGKKISTDKSPKEGGLGRGLQRMADDYSRNI